MHKLITFSATSAMLAFATLPATATVNKTWVSSTGTDTGSCQLVAPCKTFAYAIAETNAGGEIDIKDSGAYGAFTIAKSITIVADGVLASVGVGSDGHGIDITSGASDIVAIRGLSVNTHNATSGAAIYINCASHITLDHVVIQGSYEGMQMFGGGFVVITNSLITNNNVGLDDYFGGTLYAGENVITSNVYGVQAHPLNSYGNNEINGNTSCDSCFAEISKVATE